MPKQSPSVHDQGNGKTWKSKVCCQASFKRQSDLAKLTLCSKTAYTFHAYGRSEGVAGLIISDHEYPALVAHQLLSKIVDEFLSKHPRATFANAPEKSISFPQLKEYIVKYQDPAQADSIMKIQKELDETKITLHKTIESVLERGEKIDNLVQKSDNLSAQSKMFYTQVDSTAMLMGMGLCADAVVGKEAELLLRRHVAVDCKRAGLSGGV